MDPAMASTNKMAISDSLRPLDGLTGSSGSAPGSAMM
jgi:hypothetical protein